MSAAGAEEKARASYEIVAFGGLTVGRRPNMAQLDLFRSPRRPWNSGRIIGPKPPLKPKHVWAIHQPLKNAGRTRDLALFDCGIDAKLRGCDLVRLRVSDVAPGGSLRRRATVIQQKTGRLVPFEITDSTRDDRPRAAGPWDSQPAPHRGRPRLREDGKSARLSAFAGTPQAGEHGLLSRHRGGRAGALGAGRPLMGGPAAASGRGQLRFRGVSRPSSRCGSFDLMVTRG